jgi:hypothetical protein
MERVPLLTLLPRYSGHRLAPQDILECVTIERAAKAIRQVEVLLVDVDFILYPIFQVQS